MTNWYGKRASERCKPLADRYITLTPNDGRYSTGRELSWWVDRIGFALAIVTALLIPWVLL